MRTLRKARGVASAFVSMPIVAVMLACGGEGAFPVAEPCTTPTAVPSPRRPSAADATYIVATYDGMTRLEDLTRNFRTRWPNDAPSNRIEYREEYVEYVRDVTCLASDLKALSPRGESLSAYDTQFDLLMDDTIAIAEFGRDAVKARNSSKYREWIRDVDALPMRYDEIRTAFPR